MASKEITPIIPALYSPQGEVWTPTDNWAQQRACKTKDADTFFVTGKDQNRVVQACSPCPVKEICLIQALKYPNQHGVSGGFTDRQRRTLLHGKALLTVRQKAVEGDSKETERLQEEAMVTIYMFHTGIAKRPTTEVARNYFKQQAEKQAMQKAETHAIRERRYGVHAGKDVSVKKLLPRQSQV